MDFLGLAERRYSSRSFDTERQIEKEKLECILRAAQLAPTGRNAQPFKVLVIQSEEGREKAALCTPCTYGAPTIMLIIYNDRDPESHLAENDVNVGLVDATIVAVHMMLEAEEQGIGSCYVELFEGKQTKELFSISEGWEPACFLPVGYSTAEPGPRHGVRKAQAEFVEYL